MRVVGVVAFVAAGSLLACGPAQSQEPAVAASSPAASPSATGGQPTPRSSPPVALVYRGPAGCEDCSEPVAAMLSSSAHGFEVRYVGPNEALKLEPSSFAGVSLYAQPGGDTGTRYAYNSLGPVGQQAIRDFVAAGGRYLGICQGAYLAGTRYSGLGLLSPGNVGWYVGTRGASVKSEDAAVIPIRWGKRTRHMYFQDGPFMIPSGAPGERVLARYTNGRAAVLLHPHGAGWVAAVGPHPEADRSWYREDGLLGDDPDGLDAKIGHKIINRLLRGS